MSKAESIRASVFATTEPLPSYALSPEIEARLREQPRGVGLLQGTGRGTVVLVKEPVEEIRRLLVPVRIRLRHQLHEHQLAPVLRTTLQLPDRSDRPFLAQAFTNIADPRERVTFAGLAAQRALFVLLYDEADLRHRLSKRLVLCAGDRETVGKISDQAERRLARIPKERFDFDQARAAIMKIIRL